MKKVYAAILTPDKSGGYSVSVPDLNIGTQGESVAECIDMARDAIGLVGISLEDAGKPIPEPFSLNPSHKSDEIVTLVDIDFSAYRRANDIRTVRKNVTIQSWLNDLAEKEGINFSQVLSDGLKQRLNIQNR
jgi:predicted RNase H-like HicB family nuclease